MSSLADWSCFVGFDYHDCFVQVCVMDTSGVVLGNRRIANSLVDVVDYVDNVRDGRCIMGAAIESCCVQVNLRRHCKINMSGL